MFAGKSSPADADLLPRLFVAQKDLLCQICPDLVCRLREGSFFISVAEAEVGGALAAPRGGKKKKKEFAQMKPDS